jgi:hypothetical protein
MTAFGSTGQDHDERVVQTMPVSATGEEPEWYDLSTNRAGQAARQKSVELRQEAPVKSILARLLGAPRTDRDYRVGADGEEKVGHRLSKLGPGWNVLHAVPVGNRGSDIDHVLVGPPGVFTLNTKNHTGKNVWVNDRSFKVSGRSTDYLRNSRYEAKRASEYLSTACGFAVDVHPLIVVLAASFTVKRQPPDVTVVARKRIAKWLLSRPPVLSAQRVEAIFEYARRDTTWVTTS